MSYLTQLRCQIQSGLYTLLSSKQSYGSGLYTLLSSKQSYGSGPYILLSSKQSYGTRRLESIWDTLCSRGFSVDIALHPSRPQRESTLAIYECKWRIFSTWCITQQVNPLLATENVVSDFLLHLHTEKQLAISTIEGYQMALPSTLHTTSDVETQVLAKDLKDLSLYSSDLTHLGPIVAAETILPPTGH
ncbi:hypothetical protein LSAT2_025069 [Lamellibrachia satsuma]|nr:hypothetical protein LSAT2_025069 [Lamellibrachia satsuma]